MSSSFILHPSSFSVRWFDSADQVDPQLWAQCFPPPLEGRWWYLALERCGIQDQFTFAYAQIEQDDRPIGIAPTFVFNVPMALLAPPWITKILNVIGLVMASAKFQKTLFVGSPCSDEGTVGLLPGISLREIAPVLQTALDERGRAARCNMVAWKDFPDESAQVLDDLKSPMGNFKLISYPGTRLPISAPGFESYLKSLKGSRRHNLKKKIRKGEERGKLVTQIVQNPHESVLQEIFALFWQTYEKGTTKFEKLNLEFFRHISRAPVAHFILMRHADSGKPAAFMLCFALGDRAINKFIGIDYTLGDDWFLYFRLWREFVAWASSTGVKELQSGQTGYRAKLDVGHALVPLTNFCKNLSPFFHRIFEKATRDVKWETIDPDLAVYLKAHGEEG